MINTLTIPYLAMPLRRSQLVIPLPIARSAVRIHYDSRTNLITNNQSTILHTQCRILRDLFSLWFATSKMVHIWCQKTCLARRHFHLKSTSIERSKRTYFSRFYSVLIQFLCTWGWLVLSRFGWFLLVWAGFDWFDCGGLGSIQLILAHFPGYGKPFIYCSNR